MIPDDVKALALPVLRHRVVLAPGAEVDGLTADAAVRRVGEEGLFGVLRDKNVKALETAKKARDAGRNVSEIRKTLKQARAAFEGGDYETAARLADEILRELEAAPLP